MNDSEISNMLVAPGDLLFARQSLVLSGAGQCSIVQETDEPTTFESHIIRVRLNKEWADPLFYFYYFKSRSSPIRSIVTQGVQAGIRSNDLKKLNVHVPPRKKQKSISDLLSRYDDLIENNRRRIQLLEESARLLYREWFVHLRFPGHEHVRIVDGVPEGWHIDRLGSVVALNQESLHSTHQGKIKYIDLASVKHGEISEPEEMEFSDAPGRARRVVRHGDIIWGGVRPNQRSHALIWNPDDGVIASTGFIVITPIAVPAVYVYYATTTEKFVGYLTNNARGAAYPAVRASDFESANVMVPSDSLLKEYADIVNPVFEQIDVLRRQNEKLEKARDLLLPRLMNGEIAV